MRGKTDHDNNGNSYNHDNDVDGNNKDNKAKLFL